MTFYLFITTNRRINIYVNGIIIFFELLKLLFIIVFDNQLTKTNNLNIKLLYHHEVIQAS